MNISEESKAMHERLSTANSKFRDYVIKHPGALKRSNFKELEMADDWLFKLQPWPTFISKKTREEFKNAVLAVSQLIRSIPQRIFNNDVARISDYYRLPKAVVKLQMDFSNPHHVDNLVGRGDFIVTPTGLTCLEYSYTSNLGGVDTPFWEARCLQNPIISGFLEENHIDIKNKDLLKLMLGHTVDSCLNQEHSPVTGTEVNAVWVAEGMYNEAETEMADYLKKVYREHMQENHPELKGELFLCDYKHLNYKNKCVYFRDKQIHTFMEAYAGLVSPQVLAVFQAGNIHLCTGPIGDILSNKLNLALLSDTDNRHLFNEEESAQIDSLIPWTRKVEAKPSTYRGEPIDLEQFLRRDHEKFVLKTAIGYGGKNVFIGNKTPAAQWDTLISEAIKGKNWIIQEYTEPTKGVYQAGDEGYAEHDVVWGFFLFGSLYAGAWTRIIPVKDNKGAINCHQGATVSTIFEVED